MKKSICILLAIAMILGGVGGVPAEAATSYEQQAEEYAKSVLADYLRIDGNAYDTVYITQGYPVNDAPDDNQRIFFVVDGDSYIAQLRVSYVDGKFCSSFMFDDNADIEAAIDSSTPFALAVADKSIVVQTAKKTTSVTRYALTAASEAELGSYEKSKAKLKAVDVDVESSSATVSTARTASTYAARSNGDYFKSLAVEYVSNDAAEGAGLCWAACIAAVLNYRTSRYYDATKVYYDLKSIYSGTPVGNTTWYERGFALGSLSCTTVSEGMEFIDIYDTLSANKPIICSVSTGHFIWDSSHAVVLKYVMGGNEYATYGFMDPNHTNTIYINFYDPDLDPDEFVYTDGSNTYSDWAYARY